MFTLGDVLAFKNRKPAMQVREDRHAGLRAVILARPGGTEMDVQQAIELRQDPGVCQWLDTADLKCFKVLMRQRMCDAWLAEVIYLYTD